MNFSQDRNERRTGVSFTVNASSSLIYKTLDDAEKLKIQLVRGVKFHGFFAVIPNHLYEIDCDRSSERVSKPHSYASSIPEFLRAHAHSSLRLNLSHIMFKLAKAGFFLPFFSTFFFYLFFSTFFFYLFFNFFFVFFFANIPSGFAK